MMGLVVQTTKTLGLSMLATPNTTSKILAAEDSTKEIGAS